MSKLPYPESMARAYPPGTTPERRRIERCRDPKVWYAGKIGQIITVHYFATFGCWDTEGRWIDYYDMGMPIKQELTDKEVANLMSVEMTRINLAHAYMGKWPDIPMSWQYGTLCEMLDIKSDRAGKNFCMGLLMRPDSESAKMLFDSRKHEYTEPVAKKSWIKKLFK